MPCSRKISAYTRRRPTRSMCTKSQAMGGLGLRRQKLTPRRSATAGSRTDTGRRQDLPDRRGAEPIPQPRELALNPAATPARVLPRQPHHQLLHRRRRRRPTRPPPAITAVPSARDKSPLLDAVRIAEALCGSPHIAFVVPVGGEILATATEDNEVQHHASSALRTVGSPPLTERSGQRGSLLSITRWIWPPGSGTAVAYSS